MPEEWLMRRDRGRRAERSEPTDPVSRLVARAATVAAGVALASLGLAFVAAQAGAGDGLTLASDGDMPEAGRRMGPVVPAVDSPEVSPSAFEVEVIVQPRQVVPPPRLENAGGAAGAPTTESATGGGGSGEPTGDPTSDGDGATESDPRGDAEPGGGDSREAWREWWDAQSDEWKRAWRAAVEREWGRDARGWTRDVEATQRGSRD